MQKIEEMKKEGQLGKDKYLLSQSEAKHSREVKSKTQDQL